MTVGIGHACADALVADIAPLGKAWINLSGGVSGCVTSANTRGLVRRENHKAQSFIDQRCHDFIVARRLGQPHRFSVARKVATKIRHSPSDLRTEISLVT